MLNTDRLLGAVLLALGTGGIGIAMQISVRTFNDDPGPKLFPILACGILVICGLGLLPSRTTDENRLHIPRDVLARGTAMAALMAGYAVALWLVGFHLATVVTTYAFYHVIAGPARRVPWRGAVYALAVTAGVHLMFAVALNAFLPRGILF